MCVLIRTVGIWTREEVENNPKALYVFGDNDLRVGNKGQACIRGLPNTCGVRTKKAPIYEHGYYCDKEYHENCMKIMEDFNTIMRCSLHFEFVIISDKIGTGLARLDTKAQDTYKFLVNQIDQLEKRINEVKPSIDRSSLSYYESLDPEDSVTITAGTIANLLRRLITEEARSHALSQTIIKAIKYNDVQNQLKGIQNK